MALEQEYDYFLKNRERLSNDYHGQFIIINNQKVIGAYTDRNKAYFKGKELFALGTFLIQQCLLEDEAQPRVFHSRTIV